MYSRDNLDLLLLFLYLQRGKQMNAFPISKSFTAVVIFLVALNGWSAGASTKKSDGADRRAACRAECDPKKQEFQDECKTNSDKTTEIQACVAKATISCISQCLNDERAEKNECNTLLKDYEKTGEELDKQCVQAGTEGIRECRKKAASCGKSLNVGGFGEDSEDDSETEGIMKTIYGIAKAKSGMADAVASDNSCTYQENEKEQDRSEQKIEKMSKLKADVASLREDIAKADDDVAKKKQDIEEEILKLEKEFDKKSNERKTEAQKETVKMQQDALESVKRKKAAVDGMDDKNTEIANLRITQQEEAIKFSESNLMKACRDQALELKGKLIESATKAAATSNQGTATTGNIKKDVEIFAKQCIKLAAVERNKIIKATQDKITRANRSVANLKDVIKQEGESFAIRQKDIEAREKLADEEQSGIEQKKTKELTQLNQKVTDIQAFTERKKASLEEKIAVKEAEFNALQAKANNMQPKFDKISADIRTGARRSKQFRGQCCDNPRFDGICRQLGNDYEDEKKPEKTKRAKKETKNKT